MDSHWRTRPLIFASLLALACVLALPGTALADSLSWTRTYSGPPADTLTDPPTEYSGAMDAVSFSDATHGWASGVQYRNPTAQPGFGTKLSLVGFTSDRGQHWSVSAVPGANVEFNGVAALPDGKTVLVGENGTIARFDGVSWTTRVPSGWPAGKSLRAVAFADAGRGWAVGDGRGIAQTTDGGLTWTTSVAPGTTGVLSAVTADATHVWAVGNAGVVRVLSGTGWVTRSAGSADLFGVAFTSSTDGWAVGLDTAFCRTVDGGTTWTPVSVPLAAQGSVVDVRSIAFANESEGMAVGDYQAVWRTSDGGDSWTVAAIDSPYTDGSLQLRDVAFVPGSSDDPVTVARAWGGQAPVLDQFAWVFSAAWTGHLPGSPAAPSGVTASDGGAPGPRATVTWTDRSSSEQGFVVQRARNSNAEGAFSTVATLPPGTTSWTDVAVDWSGTWYYRVRSYNAAGASAWVAAPGLRIDSTAPVTSSSSDGAWHPGPIVVTLSAADSQSGVASTSYALGSGSMQPYEGPVTIGFEGVTTLRFTSTDAAGNVEAVKETLVKLDDHPPVTSSDATASYTGIATIHLTATDALSGVRETWYVLDDGAPVKGNLVTVSSPGTHTVSFRSYDNAGNGTGWSTPEVFTVSGSQPTSVTIRTTATSARIGQVPILSGAAAPVGLVGKNMVVYVMKPGKRYWTYSSNRTVYLLRGAAAWQYKYYFKPGMVKGIYRFKATIPVYPGYLGSNSPNTVVITLR